MTDTGPTPEQIEALLTALSNQTRQVKDLRATTEKQSDAIKWGRRLLGAALVAVIVALGIGYRANDAADKAQDAIDLSNEQRNAARVSSCLKDNEIAQNTRENLASIGEAVKAGNHATFNVFRSFVTDPERLPTLERFLAETARVGDAAIDEQVAAAQAATGFPDENGNVVPERDCTLRGIEKYLAAQGD